MATRQALDSEAFRGILAALPDEDAAARSLNVRLAALRLRLEREGGDGAWRVRARNHTSPTPAGTDEALLGLLRLVEADGWHRIKRCQAPGCDRPFIDLTNGAIRKFCDSHRVGR